MSALLEIRDLVVRFETAQETVTAVDGISLDVAQGEMVGLVGESGSGKTVTGLSILRLLPEPGGRVISGSIKFDGEEILEMSPERLRSLRGGRIGMIFQDPTVSLNPVFTIGRQINESLRLHQNLTGADARKRAIELLEEVGIKDPSERLNDYPHQFSGGMQQRAMIAIALAGRPELLIADEPTTSLDVTVQKRILELLDGLQKKYQMTILFITHDLGIVADRCSRCHVMHQGKIVEAGETGRIINAPEVEYTKRLIEAIPRRSEAVPEAREKSLLLLEDLHVDYPVYGGILKRVVDKVKAVRGVSFSVKDGSVTALVGESGCGKTTIGMACLGFVKPSGGTIRWDGKDMSLMSGSAWRALRKEIQIVFQDPYASLNPRMTIEEVVTEGMKVHGLGSNASDRRARAQELLERVGLSPASIERYPHEFSGGQRQRIGIARALSVEPRFIILDEAVSSLDVIVQAQILDLLRDLKNDFGLTYLFVTHDLGVVQALADWVVVMHNGKKVEEGTVARVFDSPEDEYTKRLIEAIPGRGVFEK